MRIVGRECHRVEYFHGSVEGDAPVGDEAGAGV